MVALLVQPFLASATPELDSTAHPAVAATTFAAPIISAMRLEGWTFTYRWRPLIGWTSAQALHQFGTRLDWARSAFKRGAIGGG